MGRYIPDEHLHEDPPEDPPEDFAHNVHACGWNGSLTRWVSEQHQAQPCRPEFRARLDAARDLLLSKVSMQRARGLCL